MENVIMILESMRDTVQRLTSGNVSHLKASLVWAINELIREIDE